jgi:hypothetical protein
MVAWVQIVYFWKCWNSFKLFFLKEKNKLWWESEESFQILRKFFFQVESSKLINWLINYRQTCAEAALVLYGIYLPKAGLYSLCKIKEGRFSLMLSDDAVAQRLIVHLIN